MSTLKTYVQILCLSNKKSCCLGINWRQIVVNIFCLITMQCLNYVMKSKSIYFIKLNTCNHCPSKIINDRIGAVHIATSIGIILMNCLSPLLKSPTKHQQNIELHVVVITLTNYLFYCLCNKCINNTWCFIFRRSCISSLLAYISV